MKTLRKLSAMFLASALALSAMPLSVLSAEEPVAEEPEFHGQIVFEGDKITGGGQDVNIDGNKVTITHSGSYSFSGALDDGQIIVNIPDEKTDAETVKLYFMGVKLTGKTAAPVYIINAENTSINLVEGTENFLADESYYDETATGTTAVIHAKDDVTIKGDGSLRIDAAYNYGIQCNNDVKITGGKVKFKVEGTPSDTSATAEKRGDAVRAKKSVQIKGGDIDINAEGDGIKSTKGDVIFSDGKAEIKAGNDAVQGETSLQISGGSLKANGDRSLTCSAGDITITGGSICGTSTDPNPTNLTGEQGTICFKLTEEVPKDNVISVQAAMENVDPAADGMPAPVFTSNPDKKFSSLLISDAKIVTGAAYKLTIGGNPAKIGDADTFTPVDAVSVFENVKPDVPAVSVPAETTVAPTTGNTTETTAASATGSAAETTGSVAAETAFAAGDINGDTKVTVSDAVLLARIIAEDTTLNLVNNEVDRSDVDGSGMIDAEDLTYLLKKLAGLVNEQK